MAESTGSKGKAFFRVVIAGSQDAIFEELTATDRPLGAVFNARMHTTGLTPGARRTEHWPLVKTGKERP